MQLLAHRTGAARHPVPVQHGPAAELLLAAELHHGRERGERLVRRHGGGYHAHRLSPLAPQRATTSTTIPQARVSSVTGTPTRAYSPNPIRTPRVSARSATIRFAIEPMSSRLPAKVDRKSTRLNFSHVEISYAVFCLKKKKKKNINIIFTKKKNKKKKHTKNK